MERIDFISFKTLIMGKEYNKVQSSMLAPILYHYEDEFFNPLLHYLQEDVETNISYGDLDIATIQDGMDCSYIQAVCILHNVKLMPEYEGLIFRPRRMGR